MTNLNYKSIVKSPISDTPCLLDKLIPKQTIIDLYNINYKYDVSKYFINIENISIYKCLKSGYKFFFPYDIYADEKFYNYFQQFQWYYVRDRWETQQVCKFMKPTMRVLDVGCGDGEAINEFEKKGANCFGLEINNKAREIALEKKLNVLNETIEKHSIKHIEEYDAVSAFHVLEHINDNVKIFIESCIRCLKKNGLLIISVPNNDGFSPQFSILNYPPHHMGLWNNSSLSFLCKIFPIKEIGTSYSPLDDNQKKDFNKFAEKEIGEMPVFIRSFSRFPSSFNFFFRNKRKAYIILKIFKKI